MDRTFNRNAMIFSTLFLVMLVVSVAAFFYGLNIGTKKVEAKYAHLISPESTANDYVYQQQDLVSFYLTVYAPYREFQLSWNDALKKISNNEVSNVASLYKEIEGQASKKAEEAASFNLQHAGLLGQAQQSYIRSLDQFEKVAVVLQRKNAATTYEGITNSLKNNDVYQAAISQALTGQGQFYEAMVQWGISIDPNIPSEYDRNVSQKLTDWSSKPLLIKNEIIANYLLDSKQFVEYLPHDLVSSIDQFITSGQAESMNLTTVEGIISLLMNTAAVRAGDYNLHRNSLYTDEFLPQIPFFYPNVD
ncbi:MULTISPECIES: hypothetical protein [Paenibacillus]|uniref:hypothetical protein n=1 Tax=Paenibacillus TaxID=44249 RepID=UPI0020421975|nr:hypothetical protein [Paenibacillus camelliae]MCM3633097.1 hypothetical protein [Paenibacillus camelliae]